MVDPESVDKLLSGEKNLNVSLVEKLSPVRKKTKLFFGEKKLKFSPVKENGVPLV